VTHNRRPCPGWGEVRPSARETAPTAESQKNARLAGALLLGRRSSHQRGNQLMATAGVNRQRRGPQPRPALRFLRASRAAVVSALVCAELGAVRAFMASNARWSGGGPRNPRKAGQRRSSSGCLSRTQSRSLATTQAVPPGNCPRCRLRLGQSRSRDRADPRVAPRRNVERERLGPRPGTAVMATRTGRRSASSR
jgi:hypothetical protein